MKRLVDRATVFRGVGLLVGLLTLGACEAGASTVSGLPDAGASRAAAIPAKQEELRMWMTVGDRRFAITLSDNPAARAFAALLPLSLDMSDLNGNEKHVELPKALPTNASRPGTIRNGDLMLYGDDTLVLFYLTFDSSYSYTRLGRLDDPAELTTVLGKSNVRLSFTKE
jgi:hypothetical protein